MHRLLFCFSWERSRTTENQVIKSIYIALFHHIFPSNQMQYFSIFMCYSACMNSLCTLFGAEVVIFFAYPASLHHYFTYQRMCCEITPATQISLRSSFEWAGFKVGGLVTFLLLLSLMDPHCIFLYNLLQTERAVGHMSSSPEVYPWCSQVICPMWIHLPAEQLPREVWALLKVYVQLQLQNAKSR